jgi:hypothetical protein
MNRKHTAENWEVTAYLARFLSDADFECASILRENNLAMSLNGMQLHIVFHRSVLSLEKRASWEIMASGL